MAMKRKSRKAAARKATDRFRETWAQTLALVSRERKKAARQLEARLADLQARARKERQVVARMANEAAQSALAAFNIPSRREVQELTRKVAQLSRKIDSFRR